MAVNYLDALARFVCETNWKSLPEQAKRSAKRIFMDVLGADMLGSLEPENLRLGEFAQKVSGPERTSTLLRPGFPRVDQFYAALVNGTQSVAVELDEGYRFSISHAGAYVLPAALSQAEAVDASATDMLTALVVGYEVSSRTSQAAKAPKVYINQHGIVNVLGTAAAAAKLKGYDPEMTKETLRIAAAFAHVTTFSVLWEGATVRNLWVGAGARDGLMAAELAAMGFLGLPDGVRVMLERVAPTFEDEAITKELGEVYCVTRNHHKMYACCTGLFGAIEATLALVQEHDVEPDQVERIFVDIYPPLTQYDVARPRNTLAAKFSLRFAAATALVCRHANHEAFLPDKVHDPVILDLAERTQLREDPALAAGLPTVRPTRVTLVLRDGRELVKLTQNPRGHFEDPFTDEELEAKFVGLAGRLMTEKGVTAVRDSIWNPEKAGSARQITDLMRAHAKAS